MFIHLRFLSSLQLWIITCCNHALKNEIPLKKLIYNGMGVVFHIKIEMSA